MHRYLAVGGDLHALALAGGQAHGALVVAADGAEPEAQLAVDAVQRVGEVAEAAGEALLVDGPEVLHVVPAVVEDEGIEVQAVFLEQQLLQDGHAVERVVVVHGQALQVVPGVVEQEGADRRDAHAGDVIEELAVDQACGRDADDRGLAGVAFGGDVEADVAAEIGFARHWPG